MTTELTPTNGTKNEVALVNVSDALTAYADGVAPQYIIGEMLRFSKGEYLIGERDKVPVGTTFTVNVDELMAGWLK